MILVLHLNYNSSAPLEKHTVMSSFFGECVIINAYISETAV